MKQGLIHIYSGDGHGKSPAALGKAVMAAAAGERVVIIQFLRPILWHFLKIRSRKKLSTLKTD